MAPQPAKAAGTDESATTIRQLLQLQASLIELAQDAILIRDEEKTYPGLGIGLHISHEIVERHGGRIWVESIKGEGATFFVSLPLRRQR